MSQLWELKFLGQGIAEMVNLKVQLSTGRPITKVAAVTA